MKTTSILIGLTIAGSVLVADASAQGTSKEKVSSQSKSASTSSSRVRRTSSSESQTQAVQGTETKKEEVTQPAATAKEASQKEATPSSAVSAVPAAKPAAKPETTPDSKPAEAKPVTADQDPVAVLREQINAAKDPDKLRLQLSLSEQLVTIGKKSEALQELNSISKSEVFDPTTFYNVGNAYARLGETDAAINSYRKAIEQRNGSYARAYNNMGVVMLRVGRWDEASDALLTALKLESFHYAEASYNLGRVYAARGQSDLAVREWQRALKVDPQHKAAALALSRHAVDEERIVVEPQTVGTSRAPENSAGNAPVAKRSGEKPSTTKSGSAVRQPHTLTIDQTSFDYLQRARNSSDRGNLSDAIDSYRRLISRQGGYFAPANLEVSFVLISLKRYDEALENLQQVASRDGSRYPISYFHLARAYEAKGDLKQAEQAFAQAAAAYGAGNAQFLLDLSRVREKQGDYKGALEAMEKYVSQIESDGLKVVWSDERLTALRQKAGTQPK